MLFLLTEEMNEPLVSVILPTYNRAYIISRAISSVLNQTYRNLELIVIDDGSTDNTKDVVKNFNDDRLKYINHKQNKGANAARNIGINYANGEYVAFQDSDDEWLPEKIEKQINVFKEAKTEVGVVYTSFWSINDGISKTYYPPSFIKQKEGNVHEILLETNFISTPTAIVKKECFEKVGLFDEGLPRLQEWELWIKISKHYRFKHIDEPLVNSYLQPNSISRNMNAWIIARKRILEKYSEEISKKPVLLGKHYFEIGTLLCLYGEIKEGRSYFFKGVKTFPFNIKLLFSTLFSLFGLSVYNKATTIYLKIKEVGLIKIFNG
jgi:glycosyltransferase involved in cell wall biosynthesis